MELKRETSEALDAWLGPETWDSLHHEDDRRFYLFVSQYQRDHGFSIYEVALRDEIKNRVTEKGRAFGSYQENLVHELVNTAYNILRFLQATER